MSDWKSFLKKDPVKWLLETNNPSVRYFTLLDILEKPEQDKEVVEARENIMKVGIVPKILTKQESGGYWDEPERFYVSKYKGTVWQLIILAELMADGKNKQVIKAKEFIMENSRDFESNGYAYHSGSTGGGRHSEVIPCLTGNMVWSLIRLGSLEDERVQDGIKWINKYQRFDDQIAVRPKGWPYDRFQMCYGKHTCHMGVVKALKALTEIPEKQRSSETNNTIEKGVDYILKHHIYKRSHDLKKVSKPGWLRFGFPLMYQTDILEILGILTKLGYKDKRMQDAVDKVVSRQDNSGRWELKSTFNGRFQTNIEVKGKPSKWITLNALRVLKNYYS